MTEAPGEKWSGGGTGGFAPGSRQLPREGNSLDSKNGDVHWGAHFPGRRGGGWGRGETLGNLSPPGSGAALREGELAVAAALSAAGEASLGPALSCGCTDHSASASRVSSFPAPLSLPRPALRSKVMSADLSLPLASRRR